MNDLAIKIGIKMGMFDADLKKASLEIRQFEQVTKGIASTIGRYAGALGIATTAIEVFKVAANANRDSQMELLSTLKGVESTVKDFFSAILTGDWSVFENGILNAISLAKLYQKQLMLADLAGKMGKNKAERYEGQRNNYEYLITSEFTSKQLKQNAYDRYKELTESEIRERQHTNMYLWNSIATVLEAQNIKSIKSPEELLDFIDKYLDPKTLDYGSLEFWKWTLNKIRSTKLGLWLPNPGMSYVYDLLTLDELKSFDSIFKRPRYEELSRLQNVLGLESNKLLLETLDLINDNIDKIGTAKKDLDDAKADLEKALLAGDDKNNKEVVPEGSLAWYDKLILAKRKELNLAINNEDRKRVNDELEQLTKTKHYIELELTMNDPLTDRKDDLGNVFREFNKLKSQRPDNLYKVTSNTDMKLQIKDNYDYADSLAAIASVMGAVSNMTNEGAAAWLTWTANVLSAITTAIPALRTLVAAKTAEAGVNAAASAALTPVIGWLLTGAAVASVFAAVASLPKFATGGIVGGNSTIGDMNLARVNAGEMILNNRLQRNLFNLLNGNGTITSGNSNVTFKIQGKELVGVLNNYNNQKNKVR